MGKGVKSLITRVVALGVGVAVAVLLAQWWAARAERQFQEHLRHATVAELRVTAQKREWDPTVYYWLGVKLTEQAQPDEAVQVLTRAVGLDPHDAAARAALEKARAAAMARQQERLRYMGVPELKQLVALQPNNPESNYWLGVKLTEQGQPNEAVPVLARSLQVNPNSAGARTALGLALARTDKPGEAEEQLKQALALDPKLELAHFTLGSLYYKFGRWEETLKELKTAADLDPNDVDAQYLLATTYGEVFQEDKKLDILENLVRRDPDNTRYLTSLGYVYLFFGKFGQAEALYHKILTLTPNDQEAHYLYGRSLAEQASSPEEFAQAERELTGVIQKVPNDPGVHLALGILYFRRNESARAVPELERSIKLGVREYKTWYYLGQAYSRVGRTADSRRTLETFQRIAGANRDITQLENRLFNVPDDTAARRRLIGIYMSTRDYKHALNHLNMLLAKNPQDVESRRLTQECRQKAKHQVNSPILIGQ